MFNSFLTLVGTPLTTTTGANVTVEASTSNSLRKRNSTSNSTALVFDGSTDIDSSRNISSPSVSPVKESGENSMSSSSSYVGSEENLSLNLKHGIDNVNLDNPEFQKFALRYLLEKMRDHEDMLIQSAKENKGLRDEISELYELNNALAAENVSIQELITNNADLKKEVQQLKDNYATEKSSLVSSCKELENEIRAMKEAFVSESDQLRLGFAKHTKDMRHDVKILFEDVDYLDEKTKDTQLKACHNQIQIESIKDSFDFFQKELIRLERDITVTNQYNRRENLIIDGIPDHVPQEDLENVCLDIVHGIGFLPVGGYDVVGCHRLKKSNNDPSTPTIIRFVNRKVPEFCKRNKWRLRNLHMYNWNLSFREDLCEANEAILEKCEELKAEGIIKKVFTYNGFVKVVQDQERPRKVTHMKDLYEMFELNHV